MRLTCLTATIAVNGFLMLACRAREAQPPAGDTTATGRDSVAAGAARAESALAAPSPTVTATMRDANGRDLGTLALTEAGQGIAISGTLRGLPPGEHAFHVHTTGRCEPPTFASAGAHWNPTNRQHGGQNPAGPHFGDLPNVTVGADGTANVQATTPGGTLRGQNALLDGDGAAVVVHARTDDERTDPAGNAGDRIACGVVTPS